MIKFIIAAVVITIVGLVGFAIAERAATDITTDSTDLSISEDPDTLTVTISGEVRTGGTYVVPLESTLGTLIEAAGGATTNADPLAYDTAFLLEDKQTFYIAPIYDNSNTCSTEPIDKVNINTDDKATLTKVGAIGTTIASAIVTYRTENGPFKRIEELKNVSGIGNATFEKVKDFVQILSKS
jgi:competence protein ComEA